MTHMRSGADLALVDAGVPVLRVLDLEVPVLRTLQVDRSEPLVAGVRVPADGQEMDVPVPHPGYLSTLRTSLVRSV